MPPSQGAEGGQGSSGSRGQQTAASDLSALELVDPALPGVIVASIGDRCWLLLLNPFDNGSRDCGILITTQTRPVQLGQDPKMQVPVTDKSTARRQTMTSCVHVFFQLTFLLTMPLGKQIE